MSWHREFKNRNTSHSLSARGETKAEARRWKRDAAAFHADLAAKAVIMTRMTKKQVKYLSFLRGSRPPMPWYYPGEYRKGFRFGGSHPKFDDGERIQAAKAAGVL